MLSFNLPSRPSSQPAIRTDRHLVYPAGRHVSSFSPAFVPPVAFHRCRCRSRRRCRAELKSLFMCKQHCLLRKVYSFMDLQQPAFVRKEQKEESPTSTPQLFSSAKCFAQEHGTSRNFLAGTSVAEKKSSEGDSKEDSTGDSEGDSDSRDGSSPERLLKSVSPSAIPGTPAQHYHRGVSGDLRRQIGASREFHSTVLVNRPHQIFKSSYSRITAFQRCCMVI